MRAQRLAAWLDSYGVDLRAALQLAADQGYRRVYVNTTGELLDPREFTASARRHFRKYLSDLGLQLDTCSADYPGLGLADPRRADERLARFRDTLQLCADLQVARAGTTLAVGTIEEPAPLAQELVRAVAELSDRFQVTTCVGDPGAAPQATAGLIASAQCPQLRLALDTARLAGTPLDAGLYAPVLGAIQLRDARPQGARFEEVPFGQGAVDFAAALSLADAAGGDVSLVVRHDGGRGVDALRQGREYIAQMLARA